MLLNLGYKIDTDWRPVRIELYSDELGYLDIHPFVLNEDGISKQADLEGGAGMSLKKITLVLLFLKEK